MLAIAVVEGRKCPMEPGFCVMANGTDQNEGVIKLNEVDGNTPEAQATCLDLCQEEEGATGCEVIWDQSNRGCYAHTSEVDRGNKANNHTCWIFSKCQDEVPYVQGNKGENACPAGSFPIYDSTECEAAANYFGYAYSATNGKKDGTPSCHYCRGCTPKEVRLASGHAKRSSWLCKTGCPVGYKQSGTLSADNDIPGKALGQSKQSTIDDCKAKCEAHPKCNSFMYGGKDENQTDKCELAEETAGTNSWGTNFRFCTKQD